MKKFLLLLFLSFSLISESQVLCIRCYDQNARVLTDTNNLILNGGFENGCPTNGVTITDTSFCPNSQWYHCNLTNWTCTGGGINTYAHTINSTFSNIIEGIKAAYFGNKFCYACSISADTSCVLSNGCEVTGIPSDYPVSQLSGYGGDTGVSLSQTVTNLLIGQTYELEFWTGGEGGIGLDGLFAVDVGFGNVFLRDPATPNADIGRRFVIVFTVQSSAQTIKFTNWGHFYYGGNNYTTELILDDVRLFTARDGDNTCATAIDELAQNAALSFFPNPVSSNSEITFAYPSTGGQKEIVINDINGREVARYALPQWSTTQKIKLPQMAKGVYVARLISGFGNQISNVKFVVE